MKIALVAPTPVPYAPGGAENLHAGLQQAIEAHTPHRVEAINLPSPEDSFAALMASYQQFSELDLSHFDAVISTKYPAWMVDHANHICYMLHKLRGLYDTYHRTGLPLRYGSLPAALKPLERVLAATPERALCSELFERVNLGLAHYPELFPFPGALTRAIVHQLDAIAQRSGAIAHHAAISRTVARRPDYFPPDAAVSVIHPPASRPLHSPQQGAFVFTASRLDAPKRLDLLIQAWHQLPHPVELRIAGSGPEEARLRALAGEDPRIRFLGYLSDAELAEHYARALFVPFIPDHEDYGLITLEAMHSEKAVLTTTDAGGVNELVVHESTGLVVAPQPAALAKGAARLLDAPDETGEMGREGKRQAGSITWHDAVQRLLQPLAGSAPQSRPHLVVAATFPAWPVHGGGQQRLYQLYRQVARHARVTLVALGDADTDQWLAPGFRQITRRVTEAQHRVSGGLYNALGAEISDYTAGITTFMNGAYMNALASACRTATTVVACHPFLYPQIRAVWAGPLVYEAQDVEYDVKRGSLAPAHPGARRLHQRIHEAERDCVRDSQALVCCAQCDAERLNELYGASAERALVAPNGVDCSAIAYRSLTERRRALAELGLGSDVVLFMGSRHPPNVEAALRCLDYARALPDTEFWLMGSVCSHPEVVAVPANVRLLGMVSEPVRQQVLATATVALNPMTSGSGTNLKMLDYTASGLSVISTPFGMRGLGFRSPEHLLEGDPPAFPALIEQCRQEALPVREARTRAARGYTAAVYDWPVCAAPLITWLQ